MTTPSDNISIQPRHGITFTTPPAPAPAPALNLTPAAANPQQGTLFTGAASATVVTSESTASVAYTDLATSGPSLNMNIGPNGIALVLINGNPSNNNASSISYMGVAVSGASTVAAQDTQALYHKGTSLGVKAHSILYAGLTPGVNTFICKYRVDGNTGTWQDRDLTVIPL